MRPTPPTIIDPSDPLDESSYVPRPGAVWIERSRLRAKAALARFESLYFPFAKFEDCNVGSKRRREEAFARNKESKGVILPHLAAWALRGAAMGAGLSTASNLQAMGVDTALLQAAFGIALCLCVVFCAVLWVGWLGLTFLHD